MGSKKYVYTADYIESINHCKYTIHELVIKLGVSDKHAARYICTRYGITYKKSKCGPNNQGAEDITDCNTCDWRSECEPNKIGKLRCEKVLREELTWNWGSNDDDDEL
jgi:hypothetical protein